MEQITKKFGSVDFKVEEGSREVIVTISTDALDRDLDIVLPKGFKKGSYAGNPIVLWNHDRTSLPIGKTLWITQKNDTIVAKAKITDKTQLGRDVWGLIQDGIISAASVGMTILSASAPTTKEINARPELSKARRVIREWEIFEWSLVTVPSNHEALLTAVSKGYSPDTLKFLNIQEPADLWQWPTEAEPEPVVKAVAAPVIEEKPAPVVDKFASLPLPKAAKPITSVLTKKMSRLELMSQDDVLRKYLGRVE